ERVPAVRAVLEVALAEPSHGGPLMRLDAIAAQRGRGGDDLQGHITSAAAVATVRAAQRVELLAADRAATMTTASADVVQNATLDERGHGGLQVWGGWSRGGRRRVRSGERGGSRLYPAKDGPIRVEGRSSRLRPSKAADVPALAGTCSVLRRR